MPLSRLVEPLRLFHPTRLSLTAMPLRGEGVKKGVSNHEHATVYFTVLLLLSDLGLSLGDISRPIYS